jgi:sulfur-carrier protein
MIRVRFTSHLTQALGARTAEVDARTVKELLKALSGRFGRPFDERVKTCKVIVNGTSVAFLQGPATALSDGDEVVLLPPVAGG